MKQILHRIWIYWITFEQCVRSVHPQRLNLGDKVLYCGETWILTQGSNNPYWNLSRCSDGFRAEDVPRHRFKKLFWRNIVHGFRSTWRFYSGYWHAIWLRQTKDQVRNSPIKGFWI